MMHFILRDGTIRRHQFLRVGILRPPTNSISLSRLGMGGFYTKSGPFSNLALRAPAHAQ
jgi:hypothetical protein